MEGGGGGRRHVVGVCSSVRDVTRRMVWGEVRCGQGTILYGSEGGGGVGVPSMVGDEGGFQCHRLLGNEKGNEEGVHRLMGE
jgi:hypothetical protein